MLMSHSGALAVGQFEFAIGCGNELKLVVLAAHHAPFFFVFAIPRRVTVQGDRIPASA